MIGKLLHKYNIENHNRLINEIKSRINCTDWELQNINNQLSIVNDMEKRWELSVRKSHLEYKLRKYKELLLKAEDTGDWKP